jgi:hypothetical protein
MLNLKRTQPLQSTGASIASGFQPGRREILLPYPVTSAGPARTFPPVDSDIRLFQDVLYPGSFCPS